MDRKTNWGKIPNPVTAAGWRAKLKAQSVVVSSGCWLHQGAKNSSGYPSVRVLGVKLSTSQAAYKAFCDWGWMPADRGQVVMHSCDVRHCVNPDHLRLGTQSENMRDMCAKKRRTNNGAKGSRNTKAKLGEAQVPWLRQMLRWGVSARSLAEIAGVSTSTIYTIKHARFWRHV